VASPEDPGRRRLPANRPIDLRWRDRLGKEAHARRFLPASWYTPVAGTTVLRKADGTDLAVFAPAAGGLGSALAEGQYRLTFTYRRDNTAIEAGSTILSRAGDRSDEVVTLDIPWSRS